MSIAGWSLFVGTLLILMVLGGRLLSRLLLSAAMVYLAIGYVLGPGALGLIAPNPMQHAGTLEIITEGVLLISLFSIGLKLGVPILDRRWLTPLSLAFPSLALTVALIAALGVWGLGMSVGGAVLLGGILAPTDPVLASGVQSESGNSPDGVRFSLSGEGALNDGLAFPFVLLGLGLLDLHPLGAHGWHWWLVDFLWATLGGLAIGTALGALIGALVVYLRTRHRNAIGLDEFLALGLIALTYGAAISCQASGFLAVFAAGLALRRVREHPLHGTMPLTVLRDPTSDPGERQATHSHHASASMNRAVHDFNEQLEKLAELAVVLIIGAMLPYATPDASLLWFVPLMFLVVRPAVVHAGLIGQAVPANQRRMIGWFGIRGIGSIFYLLYAIHHGVEEKLARELITVTLMTVACSIFVHGATVHPLMKRYNREKAQ